MKLVVDMNLSVEWVSALQGAGVDAVYWSTVGAPDAGDDDIMLGRAAAGLLCSPVISTSA